MNMSAIQLMFLASVSYEVFILGCNYLFKIHKAKTAWQIKARILLELIFILNANIKSIIFYEKIFKGSGVVECESNMLKPSKSWKERMFIHGFDGET
jgi:hypothetical protein